MNNDKQIAVWVGLHYAHDFGLLDDDAKTYWRQRYAESTVDVDADTYLKVTDLEPGKHYCVVEVGDADPLYLGATVLGCSSHLDYNGVTVALADPKDTQHWVGTLWGINEVLKLWDGDARFEEIE